MCEHVVYSEDERLGNCHSSYINPQILFEGKTRYKLRDCAKFFFLNRGGVSKDPEMLQLDSVGYTYAGKPPKK
jgi:hypothetical protein